MVELVDTVALEAAGLMPCGFETRHRYSTNQYHYGAYWEKYPMAKKKSGDSTSSLAGKILSGSKKATQTDAKKLAASVLSQDEVKGPRKKS